MAGYKTRSSWSAPDISFDKDGRRIRPGKSGLVFHETCGTEHFSYTPCRPQVPDLMKALEESLAAVKRDR